MLTEQQTLQSTIQQLNADRSKIVNEIDTVNLERYETMRPQKANQPLARLTSDDTCSACGIRQTGTVAKDIRRGAALMTCVHCKRILVAL